MNIEDRQQACKFKETEQSVPGGTGGKAGHQPSGGE